MRRNQELDEKIMQAFRTEAKKVEIDDRLKMNIDRAIRISDNREEKKMKHLSLKKKIIVGLACCTLICTGIFAGGAATSLMSHTNLLTVCRDYSKLDQQEKKLGFKVDLVKDFSNGYTFESMNVDKVEGYDDDGNKVETFNELNVEYKNPAGKNIGLSANQRETGKKFRETDQTLKCRDVVLHYYLDTYKFVPENYKMTAEDQKNMEREDYEISVGTDQVEIKMIAHVDWEKDGVRYDLMGIDTDMTADEMLNMASELVK